MNDDYAAWRGKLAEANDPAFWPIEAIDRELVEGRAAFWCDGTAALVARVMIYPGGARVLEALAGAGDMAGLIDRIEPETRKFAEKHSLTHRMIAGRDGWRRIHKGWRHYQTILVQEI